MLKPRYKNFQESVSDFNRMLDGMNTVQPLEKKPQSLQESAPAVYQADADVRLMMDAVWHYMPADIKESLRYVFSEEQRLADIYDKLHAGRIQFNEADKEAMGQSHDNMADRYHQMANKYAHMAKKAHSKSEREKYMELHDACRRKAQKHEKETKKYTGKRNLPESRDPAHLSKYRNRDSALRSFRVLSGLEEAPMHWRDPGMSGTTRFNESYFIEKKDTEKKDTEKEKETEKEGVKGCEDDECRENTQYHEARTKEQQLKGQRAMARRAGRVPWLQRGAEGRKSKGHPLSPGEGEVQRRREQMKYGVKGFMGNPLGSKEVAKKVMSPGEYRKSIRGYIRQSHEAAKRQGKPKLPK